MIEKQNTRTSEHLDVLIVGAGISGICMAYYLQARCPQKRFTLLEAREASGGTWDLFQYPGVRSDSDQLSPIRLRRSPRRASGSIPARKWRQTSL